MMTMTERYEKYLTVTPLVLSGLGHGQAVTGKVFHQLALRRGNEILHIDQSHGFDQWARTPFWEFVEALAASNFLSPDPGRPHNPQGWGQCGVRLTSRGRRVLGEVLSSAPRSGRLLGETVDDGD